MKTKFVLIFVLIITLISCNDTAKKSYDLFAQWTNKKIEFPQDINFYTTNKDNNILEVKSKVKLLRYIDSSGCSSCKLKLEVWNNFIKQIMKLSDNKCPTIITFNPKDDIIQTRNFKTILKTSGFDYPIFIDYNDSLNILNNFPSDERFHCFLLDENNRVILIGNPVQNPKINDLYIRTICERLGIDTTNLNITDNQNENCFSFGRFSFSDTMKTQFVLKNDSLPELKIDSIFTSCECTSASANKSIINKNDSAIISVTFKTDKPEEFSREVYVKTNSREKQIVYTVDGVAY